MFSERGYDAATFQAIALRADLTRPAINHYFSSKRVLYWEVVDQTNNVVVAASIQRARRETTLIERVSALIATAIRADSENRSSAAFLITAALESHRHPELSRVQSDAVITTRMFLLWAVNDAIERGELPADSDASSLAETLLAILCGLGFYAGFVGSPDEMGAITDQLRRLLVGSLSKTAEQ